MHQPTRFAATLLLAGCAVLAAAPTWAQSTSKPPASDQVVVPQVDRRDVRVPRFPSRDFEVGVFAGTYGTQNFGSSAVGGLRLGYHITEDFFVEGVYAQTKVSDVDLRQIFPNGGVFPNQTEKLKYYNLSVGVNLLPGEIFIGRNTAKASAVYLIGGVGSTDFVQQRKQTVNVGLGMRVFFTDKTALQVDMRDHIFSLDLLGVRKSTQNLELTAGFTYYF